MPKRLHHVMTKSREAPNRRSQDASRNGKPRAWLDESDAAKFESGRRGGAAIAALLRGDGLMPHRAAPARHLGGEEPTAP
jgi:hypothetical protein